MLKVELQDPPLSAKSSVKSFVGSAGIRLLNDITNVVPDRQTALLKPVFEEGRLGLAVPTGAKEYAQLLQENAALLKLLEERNGIVEHNNLEIQKFKMALQKLQQQNWQLAQTNSLMFSELNLAKDKLKLLQHELSCKSVVLKTKTVDLEKLKEKVETTHAPHKVDEDEPPTWGIATLEDHSHPVAKRKLPSRKRATTSRDLCSSTGNTQSEDKDGEQRRSTRRRSSTGLKSQSNEHGISNVPETVEQMNLDQPLNSDRESATVGCNNETDEQEVENSTSCKTDLKSGTAGCNNGRNEQEVENSTSCKTDLKSGTAGCNNGRNEHEIKNSTSCKTDEKQIKSKLKHGRSSVNSQTNELVIAEVKEPPEEGIAMKLDSQPSTTKLSKRKACWIKIRNLPGRRNGREKEKSIMGTAPRICAKDKEHETGILIRNQSLIIIEDSNPTGQREPSSSTSGTYTKLTAENVQSENVAASETYSERQDRKSLPVPTTKEAESPTGRPSRRATIGISYKERPINIKMRRPN